MMNERLRELPTSDLDGLSRNLLAFREACVEDGLHERAAFWHSLLTALQDERERRQAEDAGMEALFSPGVLDAEDVPCGWTAERENA